MKRFIFILVVVCIFMGGCCAKRKVVKTDTTAAVITHGATLGKVSHQYRATGCATVIVCDGSYDLNVHATLIPRDTLAKDFDVDGLEIYFDYRPLKMKNPAGCTVGIPALISNISKK